MKPYFTRQEAESARIVEKIKDLQVRQKIELDFVREAQTRIQAALARRDKLVEQEFELVHAALAVKPSTVKRRPAVEHAWYTPRCSDDCYGCQWCAGGLQTCQSCGAFEGATTTHCPRYQLSFDAWNRVYRGEGDYRFGKWIDLPSRYSPVWWTRIGDRLGWNKKKGEQCASATSE